MGPQGGQSLVSTPGGDLVGKGGMPLCAGTRMSGAQREKKNDMIIIMPFLWSGRMKRGLFLLPRILPSISCLGLVIKDPEDGRWQKLLVGGLVG